MNTSLKCMRLAMSGRKLKLPSAASYHRRLVHSSSTSLFSPTEEHQALRDMVRSFVEAEVEPQAMEFNKHEKFNIDLFRKLGDLGLLGITVESQYGGSEMDAVAAVIVHGKLGRPLHSARTMLSCYLC
jgi:alkylation response protein AidB-like acyl-CoA dehydrogenase